MRLINEGTAIELQVARRGDDGSIVTPTTLKYRVDEPATAEAITAWTSLTPAAITSIAIPAATNIMRDSGRPWEDRTVTIMANEGLATQEVTTQTYRVENQGGIS